MTPSGWRHVGLFDVVEVGSGQVDPREMPYRDWPLVAPNHIEEGTGRLLPAPSAGEQGAISGKYMFSPGDVLYSKIRPYLRKVALPRFPGLCSADMYPLRSNGGIDPGFLFALLLSKDFTDFATSVSMRTGIPKINREELGKFRYALPPLGEQRKIAAILSSLDDASEATNAVIDQLQVVRKAMMAELLSRGLPGRHTRFKMTGIGDVPEEWEVVTLGEVCERMFVGIAQAATHAYVTSGGVPIIRTTNVRPNRLRVDDILRINDEFAAEMRSKRLREGDVLSARTGYPGTSVVVPAEFDGAQCFTLLVSRPGPRLLARFLCHMMNSEIGARIVRQGQAGGAQQNLNVGVFEKATVGLPGVAEQAEVCANIDAAYEREHAEEAFVVGLRALKASLMSVLLTGEVRVKPDEEPA